MTPQEGIDSDHAFKESNSKKDGGKILNNWIVEIEGSGQRKRYLRDLIQSKEINDSSKKISDVY